MIDEGPGEIARDTRASRARTRMRSGYERDRKSVDDWIAGNGAVSLVAIASALAAAFVLAVIGVHF